MALNRAVAVAETSGAEAALASIDGLDFEPYHLFHAIRANLLERLGCYLDAAEAYQAAISRMANAAKRAFLQRRRDAAAAR